MKIKVLEVKTDPQEVQTGTCELCFGTQDVDNPVFVFQKANDKPIEIPAYCWSWGDYMEADIWNIVNFTAWLEEQNFKTDTKIDDEWFWDIASKYHWEVEEVSEDD